MTQDPVRDAAQDFLDAALLVVGGHDYQDLAGVSLGPLFGGEVLLRVLLYGEAGDDLAVAASGLAHAAKEVQEEPEEEQHGDGAARNRGPPARAGG